jgi:ATPase subunit of ABC transporter with duplicated ATPase domains
MRKGSKATFPCAIPFGRDNMMHRPILLKDVSLSFPHKTCFERFSVQIHYGSRIAIVGRNGTGKSTLLKMLLGRFEPSEGEIKVPDDTLFGYVPQVIGNYDSLSGGERLNRVLSEALTKDPNVLLLDEPTNHLDLRNRRSLMRWLSSYHGTLIAVSHDVELLRTRIDTFWHIDQGKIDVFAGSYDCYLMEREKAWDSAVRTLSALRKDRKKARAAIQAEQKREAENRRVNSRENDRSLKSRMKEEGSRTSGKLRGALNEKKARVDKELLSLRLPEVIKPKFSLKVGNLRHQMTLSVSGGSVWRDRPIVKDIRLSVAGTERVALFGDNGSGKTTIIKAILGDEAVGKSGEWCLPRRGDVGYLDQHYGTLRPSETVLKTVRQTVPDWSYTDTRSLLNDFLFRKNEEVDAYVFTLSGGEKARLSLAQIAARTPKLLILDEVTNNLDLETREHVIQVLAKYPGAMIIVSHDRDFLRRVGVSIAYEIRDSTFFPSHDW